ncbi:alcohol dehydrogenase catalytic domain-containing protein [Gordonia sp. OPL2]|uniref:alcohol dehydrogenase catalytic domain-containing protein n=1 Tax=Gordonia sp. OPL2 TaxID=2486274 RepID=UPI0016554B5B|nr:alcohol dehydrogenase catalytic domain-containing protein [Gordonia sp. OPL2]ROZ89494.1 alcohol dehydrogenase [Gordonia sp. OPL2]
MRAAVTAAGSFAIAEVPDPTAGPGDLVLAVAATGVCGSDLSTAPLLPDGTIMGHEFAGVVVAAGTDVEEQWPLGSPVASMPVIGCTRCRACVTGDIAHCPDAEAVGLGLAPGALAEYVRVRAASSVRLDLLAGSASVVVEDAALAEPLAVGLHAVTRAQVAPDDRVLVLGAGPVGLAVLHWMSRMPSGEIVCSDPSVGRRAAALEIGADVAVAPDEISALRGNGFDVVVECVGKPGMVAAAVDASGVHGTVVIAGVCMGEDTFLPVAGVVKETTVHFVSYYTKAEFTAATRAVVTGAVDSSLFVTERVGLGDVGRVFDELRAPGDQRKVLIAPR